MEALAPEAKVPPEIPLNSPTGDYNEFNVGDERLKSPARLPATLHTSPLLLQGLQQPPTQHPRDIPSPIIPDSQEYDNKHNTMHEPHHHGHLRNLDHTGWGDRDANRHHISHDDDKDHERGRIYFHSNQSMYRQSEKHREHGEDHQLKSNTGLDHSHHHRHHSHSHYYSNRSRERSRERDTQRAYKTNNHGRVPSPYDVHLNRSDRQRHPSVHNGNEWKRPLPHSLRSLPASKITTATATTMDVALAEIQTTSCQSPVLTPTKKVIHESTLVTLRPSTSPRSFPIDFDAFELAAEALKSPIPPRGPQGQRLQLAPIVFGSAQAKGMRPYMEDRHIIKDPFVPRGSSGAPMPDDIPRCFAAVYDGHNGTLAADHAADHLHDLLATEPALRTCTGMGPQTTIISESEKMTASLTHVFEATDAEILRRCQNENTRGGATGVVILRVGEVLYAAHCGDSRAVLCRNGEPLRLTEDHKPNLPRERKRVEALGGRVDFARCWRVIVEGKDGRPATGLAVSRSFGDPEFKEPSKLVTATPDVMSERLTLEDSFVVLASDGLWDVINDKQACEIVSKRLEGASAVSSTVPDELKAMVAAESLVKSALEAGTMDNVTAVVGLIKWV